jgi:hypothetical protein
LVRKEGLLPYSIRDVGEFAFIEPDGREVVCSTYQVQGSQCFPHLLGIRIDGRDRRAGADICSGSDR